MAYVREQQTFKGEKSKKTQDLCKKIMVIQTGKTEFISEQFWY